MTLTVLDFATMPPCESCGTERHDCGRVLVARCHPLAGLVCRYHPADRAIELTCAACSAHVASVAVAIATAITSTSEVRTRGQRQSIADPVLDMLARFEPPDPTVLEAGFTRLGQAIGMVDPGRMAAILEALSARDVPEIRSLIRQWIDAAPEDGHVH